MANLTLDGVTIDIADTSTLALIKGVFDKKEGELTFLKDQVSLLAQDGKYKVGEEEKEYNDMNNLYTDMNNLYQDMCGKYNDMKQELDSYKKKYGDMKGKHDALEAELATRKDENAILNAVKIRRQLERQAVKHLKFDSDDQLDVLSNRQIQEKVINARYGFSGKELSERSDAEINGMFAVASKEKTSGEKVNNQRQQLENLVTNDDDSEFKVDNSEYLNSIRDASSWINKL